MSLSKLINGDGGSCCPGVEQPINMMRTQMIPHILYFKNMKTKTKLLPEKSKKQHLINDQAPMDLST